VGIVEANTTCGQSGDYDRPALPDEMIQHVTREIRPETLERCLEFYGLLGFERVQPPGTLADRAAWLQLGPTQLHLLLNPDAGPAPGHIAIVADPYNDTLARLRAEGHEVQPRSEHWGAPRSYVRDPAGHLVELMASPPVSDG
jgi:catechol 2,3-dioxygenase-like lactoylglutathione lyase family enzyme